MTALAFWIASLLFGATSVFLFTRTPLQEAEAPASLQSPVLIPVLLFVISSILGLIAWIGALVLMARLGAWGWFAVVLLLGTIGFLTMLIFGPDEYVPDSDDEAYDAYEEYSATGPYAPPRSPDAW